MAIFTPSSLVSEIRGSVGEQTFSRNGSGIYVMSKLTQTNPDTPAQQVRREAVAEAVTAWQSLSDAEAQQWIAFAKSNRLKNRLGVNYTRSGFNEFVNRYVNRSLVSSSISGFAPLPRVRVRPLEVTTSLSPESMEVAWRLSNDGYNTFVVVYATRPLSSGIRFINPSFLRVIAVLANSDQNDLLDIYAEYVALFSPTELDNGKRIGFAVKVVNSDNFAESTKFFLSDLAVDVFPSIYDADYQAILDRANILGYSLPSSPTRAIQNQLVIELKNAGIWALLDSFYVCANDGAQNFSLIDWIDPSRAPASVVGSPVFTPEQGWNGAAASGLITDFNPSVDAVVATANSVHLMTFSLTDVAGTTIDAGCSQAAGSSLYIAPRLASPANTSRSLANDTTVTDYANPSSAGFFVVDRSDASTVGFSIDGGSFSDVSKASGGLPNENMGICCRVLSGAVNAPSSRIIVCVSAGGSIRPFQSAFRTLMLAYLSAL